MNGQKGDSRAFTVTKTEELSRLADEGGVENYYRITIKTRGGTILRVIVEKSDFTPDKVRPILQAAAENADKIKQL